MLKLFFQGRRLLLTLGVVVVAIILCSLGVWQWNRHVQRAELNARIDAQLAEAPLPITGVISDATTLDYRPVVVSGEYDPAHEILLRNRSYDGVTGYHLLTPLHIAGSDQSVLIDRGWIPLTQSSPADRTAFTVSGPVEVTGVARVSQTGLGGPADPPFTAERPRLDAWFRVDITRIEQQTGYALLPIFIEQQPRPGAAAMLPQPSATTDTGMGPHLGYSFQWFSFAVILIAGYVALVIRQQRPRTNEPVRPASERIPPRQ